MHKFSRKLQCYWGWYHHPLEYGGFHKWGTPNSWMVYSGKSQSKMDENWGYPYDLGNPHMNIG